MASTGVSSAPSSETGSAFHEMTASPVFLKTTGKITGADPPAAMVRVFTLSGPAICATGSEAGGFAVKVIFQVPENSEAFWTSARTSRVSPSLAKRGACGSIISGLFTTSAASAWPKRLSPWWATAITR